MKNNTRSKEASDENLYLEEKLDETIPQENDAFLTETNSPDYDNENCFGEYFSAGF